MSRTPRPLVAVQALAYGVTDAAAALGMSADFFVAHVAPELRWVRRGRKKVVAVAELQRWLDSNAALTVERDR
jgi:hypothetical protein